MKGKIDINPITRLEGHGRIKVMVDDKGQVTRTYLQVPDFKGFEAFCRGRPAEEMPIITEKICGVCPTAHHTASSKALDQLFGVQPPLAARKLRELMYCAFVYEDHLLHFYFFGGPDLILGSSSPAPARNILGISDKLGPGFTSQMMRIRDKVRSITAIIGGSPLYPVSGLPGGLSKPITEQDRATIREVAEDAIEFAAKTIDLFHSRVLSSSDFRQLVTSSAFELRTYYMGMVDEADRVNFYDGIIKIVGPDGRELTRFHPQDYLYHLAERLEPWTYQKVLYLRNIGWKGYIDGPHSGVYRVGPLARLNVSESMPTPLAQEEFDRMHEFFAARPVHNTLAYHWARLVEVMYAAERMKELSSDPVITSEHVRNVPANGPIRTSTVGACEAPRGTLFHHYEIDERAIITTLNLVVATQNSAAAISMSVDKVAKSFFNYTNKETRDPNLLEMAFRAYDPCLACATH